MTSEIDISYKNGIIAFIDILGFKGIVKRSESSPSQLRTIYQCLEFLKKREAPESWDLELVEIEEDVQKKNLSDFDITHRTYSSAFSDSIIVSVILDDYNVNASLSTLISNLSFVGSKLLMEGILIRGGITIGKIVHTETGVVFGQGLIDAYELESNFANYPRIILSDDLISGLNYPLTSKQNRFPYHQYLKEFSDGYFGFNQLIYFQVLQSWIKMSKERLVRSLGEAKNTITKGIKNNYEISGIHEKYLWLQKEYDELIILETDKP